jgi:probable addiction module antidote protein
MPKRTGDYDAWFIAKLADPKIAADYINAAVSEHPENIKVALANVAKAHTMKKVAEQAKIARESLYEMLSDTGNPTLESLTGILKALHLRIQVAPDVEETVQEPSPKRG